MKKNIILEENKSQLNGKLMDFEIIKKYFVEKKKINTNGVLELVDGKYILRPAMEYTDDVDIMQSLIGQELGLDTPTYIPVQKDNQKFIIRQSLAEDKKSVINSRLYGEKKSVHIGDAFDNTILASDYHNLFIGEYNFYLKDILNGHCSFLEAMKLISVYNKNLKNEQGQRPFDIVFGKRIIDGEENPLLKEFFVEKGARNLFKSYMVKLACFSTKNDLDTILYKTNDQKSIQDVHLLESRVNAIERLKVIDKNQAKDVKFHTVFSEKPLTTNQVLKNIASNTEAKNYFYRYELGSFYEDLADLDIDNIAEKYYDLTSYRFDEKYKDAVKKQVKKVGKKALLDLYK